MASPVEHSIYVPKFSVVDVFEAGTLLESLPEEKGLIIESDAERFELGTPINVGVDVGHHNFQIRTSVIEFEPADHVKIFGKSKIGSVAIGLALSAYEDDTGEEGTKVDYSILINHAFYTKLAEPVVKSHLQECLPRFAEKHKINVLGILSGIEKLAA